MVVMVVYKTLCSTCPRCYFVEMFYAFGQPSHQSFSLAVFVASGVFILVVSFCSIGRVQDMGHASSPGGRRRVIPH